jgi:5-methyltetrahydropteroyltriglutamate--homocysteine methyltransferase
MTSELNPPYHIVETPEIIASRIRRALPYVDPQWIVVAPDYGLNFPPGALRGKIRTMVEGVAIIEAEQQQGQGGH